jgi:putative transposase
MSRPDRRGMLDRADKVVSIRRQCTLLGVARSGVYRPPRPANDNELALMRRIDALFTAWPFLGSRRMAAMLKAEGLRVNRKRVQRLMRKMGIAALGPKPNTSKPAPGHKIYPYLLRNMTIDRPNQVWAADITYLPIGRGFLYLVAIIDWASRAVLAWLCCTDQPADDIACRILISGLPACRTSSIPPDATRLPGRSTGLRTGRSTTRVCAGVAI